MADAAPPPALVAPAPCARGFTCATLQVPLDHSGRRQGTLPLRVATATNAAAPRGVLVFLTGGPGQGGADAAPRIAEVLGEQVVRAYRLVTLDQRGTGATAIVCPQLQAQMGASDIRPPTPAAVRACGAKVGGTRSLYGTDDVVADLELLRRALDAEKLSLDGISYGTFVAERYALAHPARVGRLVLDSVVPHDMSADLFVRALPEVARVLGRAAAADVATLVRRRGNGVALLDALTTVSVVDPRFTGVREALRGGPALERLLARVRRASAAPAAALSQGLHAAALCADWRFPWGDSSRPPAARAAALARWRPRNLWPFDRATAVGNGVVQQCLHWPVAAPTPRAPGNLPDVPALLLAGERDLSTPVPWARAELAKAPGGRLLVVAGAGHGVQIRSRQGRDAVREFLLAP